MSTHHKYSAVPTDVDGVTFASKAEARRYEDLRLMELAGAITDLELQPRYDLHVNGTRIGFYKADFRYIDTETGRIVVEDVKSGPTKTPVYRLKKKMVEAIYGVSVTEVEA